LIVISLKNEKLKVYWGNNNKELTMTGLFIFLGIFVVLIVWGVHIRNTIVRYFNATKSTLEKVTELRQQILNLNVNNTDISQLQQIEKMSQELIRSLNVVVENYPELKADSLYSKMMDDIQEQNENVGAAISIFNRNVELFNNQIEVFPNNLINTLTLSKKAIRPFKDNLVNENFDYKPNF